MQDDTIITTTATYVYKYVTFNEHRQMLGLEPVVDGDNMWIRTWIPKNDNWDKDHPDDAAFDNLEKELNNDE